MTVSQLIKHLRRFTPDAEVVYLQQEADFGTFSEPVNALASSRREGRDRVILGESEVSILKFINQ